MEFLIILALLKAVDGAFTDAFDVPPPQIAARKTRKELIEEYEAEQAAKKARQNGDVVPAAPSTAESEAQAKTERKSRKRELSIGAGFNYLDFSQTSKSSTDDLNFSLLHGPSLYSSLKWNVSRRWSYQAQVKSLSGKVDDGELALGNRNLTWKAISADAIYKVGQSRNFGIVAGVQYHEISTLNRDIDQNYNFTIHPSVLLSIGFLRLFPISPRWSGELGMRVQPPILSPIDKDVKMTASVDGSVGISRTLNTAFSVGVFAFGQYQKYDILYQDEFLGGEQSGNAVLLHSNLEVRFNYRF